LRRAKRQSLTIALLCATAVASWVATPTAASAHMQAATCVRVGELNPFLASSSLNPYARTTSGESVDVLNNVYERLVDLNTQSQPVPRLATGWSHDAEARNWTFRLREGVRFHDGHELTSNDVVWSYKYMLDKKNAYAAINQLAFLKAAGVTAVGKYAVRFHTSEPVAELPLLLSFFEGMVVPAGATDATLKASADGTGPYVLKQWQAGQKSYTLTKNPSYWQAGLPKSDCIEIQEIQDATARAAAVKAGQIDINLQVDLETVGSLQGSSDVKLVSSPPVISLVIWMWTDLAPFDDPHVRQALKLVVDRNFLVKSTQLGFAVAGNDTPIPPSWSSSFTHAPTRQNIAEARRLLAKAGYTDQKPLKVSLYASNIQPGALAFASAYKEMAKKAGVDVTLNRIPLSQYWDNIWLKQPMGLSSWGVRAPAQALPLAYTCDAKFRETHYCNKKFDALVAKARATLNPTKRDGLYKQAERILNKDGGVINALFFKNIAAVRSNCTGYESPFPFYQVDFRRVTCS
jgi:peptide/nickel transport system substrate-binding protein